MDGLHQRGVVFDLLDQPRQKFSFALLFPSLVVLHGLMTINSPPFSDLDSLRIENPYGGPRSQSSKDFGLFLIVVVGIWNCGGDQFDGLTVGRVPIGTRPSLFSHEHRLGIGKTFGGHEALERGEPVFVVP